MNREQYLELHAKMCHEMVEITRKKNMDYSTSDDPFANFRVIGSYGFDIEQGFLTRMSDKMSRLANFTKNKKFAVSDESFRDTCLDLANYALLLAAYHTAAEAHNLERAGRVQAPPSPGLDIPNNHFSQHELIARPSMTGPKQR